MVDFQKDKLIVITEPIEIEWSGRKAVLKRGTCGKVVEDKGDDQVLVSFGNTIGEYTLSKYVVSEI